MVFIEEKGPEFNSFFKRGFKVKHIKTRPFKIQIKEKKGKPPPLKSYNHWFSGPAHTGILNVPSFFSISKEQTNYNLFVRWLKEIAA